MADNKKWFKVWTAILADDDFDPQRPGSLENIGRFALLGAYTALQGDSGVVEIMPDTLFKLLQVENLDQLKGILLFKNVQFEEGKNRYGKITVTWEKWKKYQEDSTAAERMKALRSKKRGEEKRGEEKRGEEKRFIDFAFQTFQKKYGEKLLIEGAKDGQLIKNLLGSYEVEKLEALWLRFLALADNDEFIKKAGISIGVFKTQINKLLTQGIGKSGVKKSPDRKPCPECGRTDYTSFIDDACGDCYRKRA